MRTSQKIVDATRQARAFSSFASELAEDGDEGAGERRVADEGPREAAGSARRR